MLSEFIVKATYYFEVDILFAAIKIFSFLFMPL